MSANGLTVVADYKLVGYTAGAVVVVTGGQPDAGQHCERQCERYLESIFHSIPSLNIALIEQRRQITTIKLQFKSVHYLNIEIFVMPRSIFRNVLIIERSEIVPSEPVMKDIEARRIALGMSVSELCARADVSRTAYYKWRKGRGMMPETVDALQGVLKLRRRKKKSSSDAR